MYLVINAFTVSQFVKDSDNFGVSKKRRAIRGWLRHVADESGRCFVLLTVAINVTLGRHH